MSNRIGIRGWWIKRWTQVLLTISGSAAWFLSDGGSTAGCCTGTLSFLHGSSWRPCTKTFHNLLWILTFRHSAISVSIPWKSWKLILESWSAYQWKHQLFREQEELFNFTGVLYEEKTICLIAEHKEEEEGVWDLSCNGNNARLTFPVLCSLLVVFLPDFLSDADSCCAVPADEFAL